MSWVYKETFYLTDWEPSGEDRKPNVVNKFDINNFYTFLESAM